jgi:hypothetical protein
VPSSLWTHRSLVPTQTSVREWQEAGRHHQPMVLHMDRRACTVDEVQAAIPRRIMT